MFSPTAKKKKKKAKEFSGQIKEIYLIPGKMREKKS